MKRRAYPITAESVKELLATIERLEARCQRIEAGVCRIVQAALDAPDTTLLTMVSCALQGRDLPDAKEQL